MDERLASRAMTRSFVSIIMASAISTVAVAHEFWIEPSTFQPRVGEKVDVKLRVGEGFVGEPVVRNAARIERFVALPTQGVAKRNPVKAAADSGAGRERGINVLGDEGADPAGVFTPTSRGTTILIYDSNHSKIELAGDKFESYLAEKGLEAIRKVRAEKGQSQTTARELYSRCCKALIFAHAEESNERDATPSARDASAWSGAQLHDEQVGLPLEIVANFELTSSDAKKSSTPAHFTVFYEGKPLAGVRVAAISKSQRDKPQHAVTNGAGRVRFSLEDSGPWLVECTHMIALPARDDADYESFWGSLTFELVDQ